MLKKTMTYTDYNGEEVTEDFYFNMSAAEIAELELSHKGGFSGYIQAMIDAENNAEIIQLFKRIIAMSIGRRSEDGRRFIKNQTIVDEFMQTPAYSDLFIELASNADSAASFVNGIVPQDEIAKAQSKNVETVQPKPWVLEGRDPTPAELRSMSHEELVEATQAKLSKG